MMIKSVYHAVERNNFKFVDLMIEQGFDFGSENFNGEMILQKAIKDDLNIKIITQFIDRTKDINAIDKLGKGSTALEYALYNKDKDVIFLLLKSDSKPENIKNLELFPDESISILEDYKTLVRQFYNDISSLKNTSKKIESLKIHLIQVLSKIYLTK